jgi:hypothetical protein
MRPRTPYRHVFNNIDHTIFTVTIRPLVIGSLPIAMIKRMLSSRKHISPAPHEPLYPFMP